MWSKNQLALKQLNEKYSYTLIFEQSSIISITFRTAAASEYGTKIQLLTNLFSNLTHYGLTKSIFTLKKKVLSSKKATGRNKVRAFNFTPIVKHFFLAKYSFLTVCNLVNFIKMLKYFLNKQGGILNTYKVINPRQVLLNFSFLNNLFSLKENRILIGSMKKYNFNKNDRLDVVLTFSSSLLTPQYMTQLINQTVKN